MIEDYFTVNEEKLEFANGGDEFDLITPFCLEGPGVFLFELAVNYGSDDDGRVNRIETDLRVDGDSVAMSEVRDRQEPSNAALLYEMVLTDDIFEFEVKVSSGGRAYFVDPT